MIQYKHYTPEEIKNLITGDLRQPIPMGLDHRGVEFGMNAAAIISDKFPQYLKQSRNGRETYFMDVFELQKIVKEAVDKFNA